MFTDRTALGKLATTLLAAAAVIVVIDFGGPPFPYRVGQTVQRDIRAKIRFEKVNQARTELRRDQAANSVPPIYSNDPRPLQELHVGVKSLLQKMAAAQSFEDVPAALAKEWALTATSFNTLRGAIDEPDKYREFIDGVSAVFEQLESHGMLDAKTQPQEVLQGSKIQVRDPETGKATTWDVREVSRDVLLGRPAEGVPGSLVRDFAQRLKPPEAAQELFQLLAPPLQKLTTTLMRDEPATEAARQAAREAVPDEKDTRIPGDLLVKQDEAISEEQLSLLRREHEEFLAQRTPAERFQRTASLSAVVLGLCALAGYYIWRFEPRAAASATRLALLGVLVVVTLALAKRLRADILHGEIVPIALAAMTLAIVYSQQFALLITFGLGLLCAWMFGTGVNDFVVLTGGTAAAVLSLNRVRSRTKLLSVGMTAGMTFMALSWATGMLTGQAPSMLFWDSLTRLLWGVIAGLLMSGILPFLEKLFGIVTDINLLELSDVSHPLLLELMRRAPGTYNHSVAVATLAEAAAEQIGANPLVARVGSYFHDIGKMLKPHYFIENQTDSINRHESLNPAMSTLIIIGHVKDGVELAEEHHLPQLIIDLIEQHHGTTLVQYFYEEAARDVRENSDGEEAVDEAAFRYPGPKPQTKEACILMLADAVESASRTLSEPNPGRIEGLVEELTLKRLLDRQFDECSITLQEIAIIKQSLIKSLNAIYHGRVKYPEQQPA